MKNSTINQNTILADFLELKFCDDLSKNYEYLKGLKRFDHRVITNKHAQISNIHHAYSYKLRACYYHSDNTLRMLSDRENNLSTCLESLISSCGGLKSAKRMSKNQKHGKMVAMFSYPELRFEIEAFLIQVKSLLDSLTQLISLTFGQKFKVFKNSGLHLLTFLESISKNDHRASNLHKLLKVHKAAWLDDLIIYRNQANHHGRILNLFFHALDMVDVHKNNINDIQPAIMPNGEEIELYFKRITKRVTSLSFFIVENCFKSINQKTTFGEMQLSDYFQENLKCWCGENLTFAECHGK